MFQQFKSHGVNLSAVGMVGGLFFATFLMRSFSEIKPTFTLMLAVAMAVVLLASLFNYGRLLKISEAPISSIAAAAQGYVELQGIANTLKPLKTPYHGIPCVWYRAWVYANRAQHGNNAGADDNMMMNSRLLDYTESQTIFTLNDGTDICSVNPKGAEVIHFEARTWRKNDHRYVEEYLPAGKSVYVLGQLDTRHDVLDDARTNHYLSQKLAEWKTRPQHLLNRYDQNRDGQIDLQEWEAARADALKQVHVEHSMRQNTGSFTLKKPQGRHLFLISAKSPQQLRDAYQRWLWVHLSLFTGLFFLYLLFS